MIILKDKKFKSLKSIATLGPNLRRIIKDIDDPEAGHGRQPQYSRKKDGSYVVYSGQAEYS